MDSHDLPEGKSGYKSRVDAWLGAVLLATAGISMYACITLLPLNSLTTWLTALSTSLLGTVLPLWLLLDTHYSLNTGTLVIRSGPFRWAIPVADINDIRPTNNPLSSPALSLDRLRIDYGKGKTIMISPRDKAAFLEEISGKHGGNRK